MDGWIDGWMDGWMNGWMDGWAWNFASQLKEEPRLRIFGPKQEEVAGAGKNYIICKPKYYYDFEIKQPCMRK
jgi:hypothetical protein